MPKVSVCVPTYNGAQYLGEALESACAQTLADIEILVVDDDSTDGTVQLAESFARRDARVSVHRNEQQQGLPGNWDRARELASGEWIAFLFQDDLARPEFLERMLATVEAAPQPVPIVCCRRAFLFVDDASEEARAAFLRYVEEHSFARYFSQQAFVPAEKFQEQLLRTMGINFVGEPTAVMLHRETLARFGRFHTVMRQLVDMEYWARVATVTGIAYVDQPLVTFRVHAGSATSTNRGAKVRKDRLDSLILLHDALYAPAYAVLRRSPRHRWRLLWLYSARVREIQRSPGPKRDAQDPSWAEAIALYPDLRQRGVAAWIVSLAHGLWRAVRG